MLFERGGEHVRRRRVDGTNPSAEVRLASFHLGYEFLVHS